MLNSTREPIAAGDVSNCSITEYRFDAGRGTNGSLALYRYNFVAPLQDAGGVLEVCPLKGCAISTDARVRRFLPVTPHLSTEAQRWHGVEVALSTISLLGARCRLQRREGRGIAGGAIQEDRLTYTPLCRSLRSGFP
jgi:hypothetical protein